MIPRVCLYDRMDSGIQMQEDFFGESVRFKIPERESSGEKGVIHMDPLQYSCLESSMDRGASWATSHGVAKSQT